MTTPDGTIATTVDDGDRFHSQFFNLKAKSNNDYCEWRTQYSREMHMGVVLSTGFVTKGRVLLYSQSIMLLHAWNHVAQLRFEHYFSYYTKAEYFISLLYLWFARCGIKCGVYMQFRSKNISHLRNKKFYKITHANIRLAIIVKLDDLVCCNAVSFTFKTIFAYYISDIFS